ncbi:MAG: DNA polymerase III subunit alpha, partial [Blautia sp.]|nr:DNA polymerase III subunit alpha [Blautia sp.]
TAWLKYYYPVEFMAALMTSVIEMPTKVADYIQVCRQMKIPIVPPDVNRGEYGFTVDGGAIRYGLSAIKGVGRPIIEALVEEREKEGEYLSIRDLAARNPQINKRAMENFIKAGALDGFEGNRCQKMSVYSSVLDSVASEKKNSVQGQMSLFDLMGAEEKKDFDVKLPPIPEFSQEELLAMEKDVLGIYISGHPLDRYRGVLEKMATARSTDFMPDEETGRTKVEEGQKVILGGLLREVNTKYTKNNTIMAFLTLEDLVGSVEIIAFPKVFDKYRSYFNVDERLFIQGRAQVEDNDKSGGNTGADKPAKLIMDKALRFDEVPRDVWLRFSSMAALEKVWPDLEPLLKNNPGSATAVIYLEDVRAVKRLGPVDGGEAFLALLRKTYGEGNVKCTERPIKNL